jgi:hypothetical protein
MPRPRAKFSRETSSTGLRQRSESRERDSVLLHWMVRALWVLCSWRTKLRTLALNDDCTMVSIDTLELCKEGAEAAGEMHEPREHRRIARRLAALRLSTPVQSAGSRSRRSSLRRTVRARKQWLGRSMLVVASYRAALNDQICYQDLHRMVVLVQSGRAYLDQSLVRTRFSVAPPALRSSDAVRLQAAPGEASGTHRSRRR